MKSKFMLLLLPLFFFTSCASNKLNQTVWHNLTMMRENGVTGNVGTSLVFDTDSTFFVYKGISIDTSIVVPPYVFAYGKYEYKKIDGKNMKISLSAIKKDGSPYIYTGEYNKKKELMILNVPGSKMKETYIWNPEAKVNIK